MKTLKEIKARIEPDFCTKELTRILAEYNGFSEFDKQKGVMGISITPGVDINFISDELDKLNIPCYIVNDNYMTLGRTYAELYVSEHQR